MTYLIKNLKNIVFALLLSGFANIGFSSHTVGNPGGDKKQLYAQLKWDSNFWLGELSRFPKYLQEALNRVPRQDVVDFLSIDRILEVLGSDILKSPHDWIDDAHSVTGVGGEIIKKDWCALTNLPLHPKGIDTVVFSLTSCKDDRNFATRTLIHESVHHLLRDQFKNIRAQLPKVADPETGELVRSEADFNDEEEFANTVESAINYAYLILEKNSGPRWDSFNTIKEFEARGHHSANWIGDKKNIKNDRVIFWGGCKDDETSIYGCGANSYFNDGAIFDLSLGAWTMISNEDAPRGRAHHSAVWTGTKLIVWGGCSGGFGCDEFLSSGGLFDPSVGSSGKWTNLPTNENTPESRTNHTTVWSGNEMIVWGGRVSHTRAGSSLNKGSAYSPATNKWRKIAPPKFKIEARQDHSAVWTDFADEPMVHNKMIIWGGCDWQKDYYCRKWYGNGGIYDPKSNQWTEISTTGAPSPRRRHSAVWAGNKMIIWGGQTGPDYHQTGGIYDPKTDRWYATDDSGLSQRSLHTAVWTGREMIVFGGIQGIDPSSSAPEEGLGIYYPPLKLDPLSFNSGRWGDTRRYNRFYNIKFHTAVWTYKGMLKWGGQTAERQFSSEGSLFHPGSAKL